MGGFFCDGAYCDKGAAVSTIIISPSGVKTRFVARLGFNDLTFEVTNNVTEYEGLLLGLLKMKALGQASFVVRTNSGYNRSC